MEGKTKSSDEKTINLQAMADSTPSLPTALTSDLPSESAIVSLNAPSSQQSAETRAKILSIAQTLEEHPESSGPSSTASTTTTTAQSPAPLEVAVVDKGNNQFLVMLNGGTKQKGESKLHIVIEVDGAPASGSPWSFTF